MSSSPTHGSHSGTEFPGGASALTHLIVVSDIDRARSFYVGVLGASVYGEYAGTSVVLQFLDTWLLLVTGGGPTKDKPDTTFAPPPDPATVSHEMIIRVEDCRAAYEELRARGAEFITEPVEWGGETRCFFRDPDGHLLEISAVR
jgi:lactoylglutathione lyase